MIDQFEDSGSRYLVMRLVEGLDLNRVLRRDGSPGLPVTDVLDHARQAAEALRYVHEQNVIHRDVKPHNLILGPAGVVVVDFGIARERADDAGTRAIGTPLYMAPEVLVGEEVSPRSDVYGLAATVWALLTGRPPSYDDPTRLTETVAGVSGQLEETLRAALAIRPERRLASMEAFAAGLGTPLGPGEGRSLALTRGSDGAERPARADRPDDGRRLRGRGGLDRARRPRHVGGRLRGGVGERSRGGGRRAGSRAARAWPAPLSSRAKAWRSPTAGAMRASPRRSRRRPATSPTRCSSSRSSEAVT